MTNEGKVDVAQSVSSTIQILGDLAVTQIKVVDKGIQTLMPAIENINKTLIGTLETGAKTAADSLNLLSEPLNTLIKTFGDVATKGLETVGGMITSLLPGKKL